MRTDAHWKKVERRPHHGICLPLFSLRTKNSCGIGEFFDLPPLIEWCKSVGFDCLQLLPLNDSGKDPSPYNPLSSCALDPVYLTLRNLPGAHESFGAFEPYNSLPHLARAEVKNLKLEWLRRYFEKTFPTLARLPQYQAFLEEHNAWIIDYARFMTLKETFRGKHWKHWPSIASIDNTAIDFHCFLQYHCFDQLKKIRDFATDRSFLLIGDVPILLSPDSADVWSQTSLFHLGLGAGAPPDKYNALGQDWGFPLFNWDAMREDGFAWWKRRLSVIEPLYHIYRIDHVVGFFRIWAIPKGTNPALKNGDCGPSFEDLMKPLEGHFVPEDPALWFQAGEEILKMMIDSCRLLPIAEDLGTIPPQVYPILKNLGICGTKVLRWQIGIPYNEYEPFSMTTVSTPDMEPLFLWWQKFPDEAADFCRFKNWTYEPVLSENRLTEILRDAHHTASFFHVNLFEEYLALFPELIWENPLDERINVPGTVLSTNWSYRFRPYLDEIIQHASLAARLRDILRDG